MNGYKGKYHKPYKREFKLKCVQFFNAHDLNFYACAKELDVSAISLKKWVEEFNLTGDVSDVFVYKKKYDCSLTCSCESELAAFFRKKAEQHGMTVSQFLRRVLCIVRKQYNNA